MRKVLVIMAVLLTVGVLSWVATAQDEEVSCTPEQYQEFASGFGGLVDTEIGNVTDQASGLLYFLILENAIDSARASCGAAEYNSETNADGILGPASFGGTLYQATFTSDTFGTVQTTVIEGDCGFVPPLMAITDMAGGEETDLWEFGGDCVAMFEVNVNGAWTLNIERLR